MYWLEYYEPRIKINYNAAYGSGCGVGQKLRAAGVAAGDESWGNLQINLDSAGDKMYDFAAECLTRIGHQNYNLSQWLVKANDYLDAMGEPEPFTMDTLINAMLTATPEQITYFIGLVDAYRLTIWNEPFNAEFYAAIARGFER